MTDQELVLKKQQAISLQGRDKSGRPIVRIVGKNFPARTLGREAEAVLKGYVQRRVLPALGDAEFVVVYMHSSVDRGENFPGVGAVRAAYESLPVEVRGRLHAVYFVHPGLQSRLFMAALIWTVPLQLRVVCQAEVREPLGVPVGAHAEGGAGCS